MFLQMAKYEFVGLIDPTLPMDSIKEKVEEIKKILGNIVDEDEIGFLDLAYPINKNDRAYFVSYLIDVEPNQIDELRKQMSIMKGLMRFFFYKMGPKDKFLKFAEVNKKYEMTEEEKAEEANRQAFQDADSVEKMNK
jgi:ribosomal protein S6